jgi:NAD(P)-dependent dehydrogenase (short-subunit alcohol dehydrogenase family)
MDQHGRVASVTGGGSGLGRAIALRLATEGASVIVADEDEDLGQSVVDAILEGRGLAAWSQLEAVEEGSIQSCVGEAIVNFGSVHLLVNGLTFQERRDALSTTLEIWDQAVAVNLEAAWLMARTCAPFMRAAGGGAMVHLAPLDVLSSASRSFALATTKGGLAAMNRALALDFGPDGIRSNLVIYGHIQSKELELLLEEQDDPEAAFRRLVAVHPLRRTGTIEEVAKAASFLLSNDSSFITGTSLIVDGGRTISRQDFQ